MIGLIKPRKLCLFSHSLNLVNNIYFLINRSSRTTLPPSTTSPTSRLHPWVVSHSTEKSTTISLWSRDAALEPRSVSSLWESHCWFTPNAQPLRQSTWSSSIPARNWVMVDSRHRLTKLPSWELSRRIVFVKRSFLLPLLPRNKQAKQNIHPIEQNCKIFEIGK